MTVLFDDRIELLHDSLDIRQVAPLTDRDYTVGGGTALMDAPGYAIHKIRKAQRSVPEEYRTEKVLFVIITDGQENTSRHYSAKDIRERIEHQKRKHGWEFVFFGANMDAVTEAGRIGIAQDRVHSYSSDPAGVRSSCEAMSAVSTSFRTGGSSDGYLDPAAVTRNLRQAVKGLAESAHEMRDTASGLMEEAEANGGKLVDVNEILRQVLAESENEVEK